MCFRPTDESLLSHPPAASSTKPRKPAQKGCSGSKAMVAGSAVVLAGAAATAGLLLFGNVGATGGNIGVSPKAFYSVN